MEIDDRNWQLPEFDAYEFTSRRTQFCVLIPVVNEGARIRAELAEIHNLGITRLADVIILDGGSTDGSLDSNILGQYGVRALLEKKGSGKLSAQLRMGYAWALREGYDGIITIDGNNKDGVDAIPAFIKELENGVDFVQGSRFIPGGRAINTPVARLLGIRLLHAPLVSLSARFHYTDTTNGFRGCSRRLLVSSEIRPFRDIFTTYELLAYLSVRAPRTGHSVKEIPVTRRYPAKGVPTKISFFKGNLQLFAILLKVLVGRFNPEPSA